VAGGELAARSVDPGDFKAYVFPLMLFKWICDMHAIAER